MVRPNDYGEEDQANLPKLRNALEAVVNRVNGSINCAILEGMRGVSEHNAYFDEAYFERGWERGTAYTDYRRAADNSKTFVEIAEAIAFIFKPRRVLEVGCATGATVRHLNAIGVEAHGIDVPVTTG